MKRLIIFSTAVLSTAIVFAQENIPAPGNNSNRTTRLDTLQKGNGNPTFTSRDTMPLNRSNSRTDTSLRRNRPGNAAQGNRKWPDTMRRNNNLNSTPPGSNAGTGGELNSGTPGSTPNGVNASSSNVGNHGLNHSNGTGTSDMRTQTDTLPNGNVSSASNNSNGENGNSTNNNNNTGNNATETGNGNVAGNMNNGGNVTGNQPPTNNNSNMTDSSTGANSSSANNTNGATTSNSKMEDRVVMVNNRMMVIKNGDSTDLPNNITLGSGAVVKSDGSVRFKDGTVTELKNGQYINLNATPAKKTTKVSSKKTTTVTRKKNK